VRIKTQQMKNKIDPHAAATAVSLFVVKWG